MKNYTTVKHVKAAQVTHLQADDMTLDTRIALDNDTWVSFNTLGNKSAGLPMKGDYIVDYTKPDGSNPYLAWCPKAIFEESIGFPVENAGSFGWALSALQAGLQVRRAGWNGKGIFIELQVPDQHSKMSSPYIFIDTTGLQTENAAAPKSRVPWLPSQTDVLAIDWEEV
jgi:hypothetical protein